MTKTCFIVSPIGDENSDIRKRADDLYDFILEPVCRECGFECTRADRIQESGIITSDIIKLLRESDLVIADMTGHNPNVFYEMGFRYALDKPVIQMIDKKGNIPFDLGAIRTIKYDIHDFRDAENVKMNLKEYIINSIKDNDNETFEKPIDFIDIIERLDKIQDQIADLNNYRLSNYLYSKNKDIKDTEKQFFTYLLDYYYFKNKTFNINDNLTKEKPDDCKQSDE